MIMTSLASFFKLEQLGSTVRQEVLAGLTTFVTMAYIIIVNPKILEAAGIPFGASMVATIVSASFGTLLMGLYANRPFAIAPYMGENAFIAFTVVKVMGYSWETALGAIFISGVALRDSDSPEGPELARRCHSGITQDRSHRRDRLILEFHRVE